MSVDERVLATIHTLYEAAVEESRWPMALQALTEYTGSQAATFWVLDGSDKPRLPTFIFINFDIKFVQAYQSDMVPFDPTNLYLLRHPRERIVHDAMVISEREKDRHPYYDWQHSWSNIRFRLIGQAVPAPGIQAGVALHREAKAGPFEAADIERYEVVHGHLERALAIGVRLGSFAATQLCTTEVLDRNPAAVLLLDDRKRIVYANRPAQELLNRRDGLTASTEGFAATRKADNDKLQCLIAEAVFGIASSGITPGGAMSLPRPSGRRAYGIFVAPLSRNYPVLSSLRPAACVMIADPDDRALLPVDRLQAVFGLTYGEARLASLLAAGQEVRAAADELGITYGTARVRLAVIFQKTQTRRQGELIQLLLATLAV